MNVGRTSGFEIEQLANAGGGVANAENATAPAGAAAKDTSNTPDATARAASCGTIKRSIQRPLRQHNVLGSVQRQIAANWQAFYKRVFGVAPTE